jgi:hypothetical protein
VPFAAPLSYTGLGLLLVMNRMVDRQSGAWPRWILLLGLGGVVGDFIFSLTDRSLNRSAFRAGSESSGPGGS